VYCGSVLLYLFANNSYLSSIFYSVMFVLPVWLLTRVLGFGMRKVRYPWRQSVLRQIQQRRDGNSYLR
jgi:hypothetical protein